MGLAWWSWRKHRGQAPRDGDSTMSVAGCRQADSRAEVPDQRNAVDRWSYRCRTVRCLTFVATWAALPPILVATDGSERRHEVTDTVARARIVRSWQAMRCSIALRVDGPAARRCRPRRPMPSIRSSAREDTATRSPGQRSRSGMVQLSPDTRSRRAGTVAPATTTPTTVVYGFSHTHLSGTGDLRLRRHPVHAG